MEDEREGGEELQWTTDDVYGLKTLELPTGSQPLEAIVAVKYLDDNGKVQLSHRYTKTLNGWEALGMAESMATLLKRDISGYFESANGPPEDDPDA